ncbi:armadillo-type protein [Halteromyces radiatus]|uniref:armadillo-type protein n=1 Tax=Halteromyces radiatus TaxID=101107 RepID=UPI002220ED64|nr:armadillo-type protein [Halteromyces radiatus]KAI8100099.1 armadillo-type protein [Halteromyces radiatus]
MDQNSVYQLFVATYHPDPNVHKQAELNIRSFEGHNGFLPIVLQILASEELELGARQAAAIYFKNRLVKAWNRNKQATTPISEEDRNVVKQSILQAMVTAPNAVKVQLTSCLHTILSNDFPEQWSQFVGELENLLSSNDPRLVYVGLLALREVVRVYQWKSSEKREPLQQIIALTFPAIQNIGTNLVSSDSLEAAEMLKLTLKIYHAGIQVDLPKTLQDSSSIVPWGTLFLQLIDKPIPFDVLPTDSEEREKYPWGKTKKWAYHCLNRLFAKYGNPALLTPSASKYIPFAKNFVSNFAPNVLQAYLRQVEGWIKNEIWISHKCLALTAAFFDNSVKHKTTWQIIKPHTETLVAHFIFPQLCFSNEDEELWNDDPVEFVHKKVDPLEDIHSPETNASNLLITLARDRKKHTFMGILGFINGVLNKYLETPDDQKNGREKDGALNMIACLSYQILQKKSPVANMMEPFFVSHVFPEFKSRFPYLRARACDMTKHFSDLDFANEQNLATLYQNVLDCLRDTDLPVKIQAALALQPMIRHESVRNAMAPSLPFIMQELLNLTKEIDIDTLATTMEEFVEVFADQLTPFAVQLCTQLRDTFLRIMEDFSQSNQLADSNDDDDFGDLDDVSDKIMAAMGVLKTIGTLILSLESTPDILQQLENALLPVITYTLKNKIMDLYNEIFEIIDSCTFSAKRVTPTMWGVFDLIYESFKDCGIDYMDEMLPPLDNYISYGRDVFVSNENIQRMMFDIIDTVMKSDRLGENDRVCACKLIESVLLNCRGQVDMYVAPFLNLAFQFIFTNSMKTTEFKVHCLEVVINCLYYNPVLTLRLLEENQWTQGFFTLWFNTLEKFSRVHDKKLVIVALCSLIELPLDHVPGSLQGGWSQVLTGIVNVFKTLPKAIENRESLEKLYGDGFDDEDIYNEDFDASEADEDDLEDIGDEDVPDQDNEYLEYLAQQASLHANDEDYDDYEEEIEEEILFESPLDEINPYIRFEQVFRTMQQTNPASYTLLTKDLDADQQNLIMSVLSNAEQQRTQQQQQQQQVA